MTLNEIVAPAASGLNVGHLTRRAILECAPDTAVAAAAQRMHEEHCGSIIVVDGTQAVGIWTERDVIGLDLTDATVLDAPVARFMSKPVRTIRATESIQALTFRFETEGIRHLLVVDADGQRIGVVSQTDVVNNQGIEFFVQLRDVDSVMRHAPLTVAGELPLADMIKLMRRFKQDAVIVDDDGRLGIFTESDALRQVGSRNAAASAREVASFPLITVSRQTSLYKARNLFTERQVRHLGVMDGDSLSGVLTYADILVSVEQAYVRELQRTLGAQAQELLSSRRTLALAQRVAESTFQGIIITDATGFIESVNPAFTAITGYAPAEVIGRNPRLLKSGLHDDAFYRKMYEALARHGVWSGEIWNRRKNDENYPSQLTVTVVRGDGGEIVNFVGVFSDLTEQKRYQEDLQLTQRKLAGQEDLNRLMLETLPIHAFIKDAEGRYLAVNERAAEYFGFAKENLIGRSDFEIFPPATAENLREDDRQAKQVGHTFVREVKLVHRGIDSCLLVHRRAVAIQGEHFIIGAAVDITERKQAEQRLEDERAVLTMIARGNELAVVLDAICVRFERHLHGSRASILVADDTGTRLRLGSAPGLAPAYASAIDGLEIAPHAGPCGAAAYSRHLVIAEDLTTDPRWENFHDLAAANGLRSCWATPILATDGKVLGTFALYFRAPRYPNAFTLDLVEHATSLAMIALERAKATEQLHRMATIDMLTNIPNRRHFLAIGQHEVARAWRSNQPLALCMIDLDGFKSVNDTYGHAAGDEVLKQMAAIMGRSTRSIDISGRLGGEEFACLLPETDLEAAIHVAERLREDVAKTRFAIGHKLELGVTISIGIAQLQPKEALDHVMNRADKALYQAKRSGRNRVVVA